MLDATKRYDSSLSSFRTYASKYIYGGIMHCMRREVEKIYFTNYIWDIISSLNNTIKELEGEKELKEIVELFSKERKIKEKRVWRLVEIYNNTRNFKYIFSEEIERLPSKEKDKYEEIEKRELAEKIEGILGEVDQEELKIFRACQVSKIKEVQDEYQISYKRVCACRRRIRNHVRKEISKEYNILEINSYF